jgi:hypothetical protein
MGTTETINIIKNSFETWYNKNYAKDSQVSIVINYKDVQALSIKAFHTISFEVVALGIRDNLSYTQPLITLQENYNHGITSEQEAKDSLTEKLLMKMYGYRQ